jgi:hypothetical protein
MMVEAAVPGLPMMVVEVVAVPGLPMMVVEVVAVPGLPLNKLFQAVAVATQLERTTVLDSKDTFKG